MSLSIIITCYNEREKIQTAVNSLLAQTDNDFEVIIINDHSPDEITNTVCDNISKLFPQIRYYYLEKNGGLSYARNCGFEYAIHDIVAFLDADDELPPTSVATIKAAFQKNPDTDFVYGDFLMKDIKSAKFTKVSCQKITTQSGNLDYEKLMNNYCLLGTSPCRKELWKRIGGYDLQFSYDNQDMDFWYSALSSNAVGVYLPEVIYNWNRNASGMNVTQNGDKMLLLYKKHYDLITKYKVNKYIELKIIAIYLRKSDFNNLKIACKQIYELRNHYISLINFFRLAPNWLLKAIQIFRTPGKLLAKVR